MLNIKIIIEDAIINIQDQHSYKKVELKGDVTLTRDLGFSSLDVAQLIAYLEIELGVDPFSQGVSIAEINTLEGLLKVYENAFIEEMI